MALLLAAIGLYGVISYLVSRQDVSSNRRLELTSSRHEEATIRVPYCSFAKRLLTSARRC
jgi:hypothetical protein